MKSLEIYEDMKYGDCKKSYVFLKKNLNNVFGDEKENIFHFGFAKLYETIQNDKLKNKDSIAGLLHIICKNKYLQDVYKNERVILLSEMKYDNNLYTFELNEINTIVLNLINSLPSALKNVMKWIVKGYSHKEIAVKLNMTYDNVRKYYYKAIKHLKGCDSEYRMLYLNN